MLISFHAFTSKYSKAVAIVYIVICCLIATPENSTIWRIAPLGNQNDECRYYISSRGGDGIGHQMEAKFSCLATAWVLNHTYVHHPVSELEHGADPRTMENLFGMSYVTSILPNKIAVPYDNNTMIPKRHAPKWIGSCNQASWFQSDTKEQAECAEKREQIKVHTFDNCWDYFWCHVESWKDVWQRDIRPLLHLRASTISPSYQRANSTLYLALHVRLGDSGYRRLSSSWCMNVLHHLVLAASEINTIDHVYAVVHSDGSKDEVKDGLGLTSTKIASLVNNNFFEFSLLTKGTNTSPAQAIADMIDADIFIASCSGLSYVAALLRTNPQTILHPETKERPRMVQLGWSMLRVEDDDVWRCAEATPSNASGGCKRWHSVGDFFWSNLMTIATSGAD
mmetsp:Transcript_24917/g.57249  ORF Transcript_24917/g.57249 Transcript_24917/m.57249 type:complete len:395 (+) Transcript_24917:3-1187(+)